MQCIVGTKEAHVLALCMGECKIPSVVDAVVRRRLPPSYGGLILFDDGQRGVGRTSVPDQQFPCRECLCGYGVQAALKSICCIPGSNNDRELWIWIDRHGW